MWRVREIKQFQESMPLCHTSYNKPEKGQKAIAFRSQNQDNQVAVDYSSDKNSARAQREIS